jgi:hypothetical protein
MSVFEAVSIEITRVPPLHTEYQRDVREQRAKYAKIARADDDNKLIVDSSDVATTPGDHTASRRLPNNGHRTVTRRTFAPATNSDKSRTG